MEFIQLQQEKYTIHVKQRLYYIYTVLYQIHSPWNHQIANAVERHSDWKTTKMMKALLFSIQLSGIYCFAPTHTLSIRSLSYRKDHESRLYQSTKIEPGKTDESLFFAEAEEEQSSTRVLGSQELLMLPRQYKPSLDKSNPPFPQLSHVTTAILSSTPSEETLSLAIEEAMASHPLLRAHVSGDGEPEKRIDAFQMVREGEPNPCTFVCPAPGTVTSSDVLSVIQIEGKSKNDLEKEWKTKFALNLDSGADWCNVEKGPLWKIELLQLKDGDLNSPCALMFTFNHAISDQRSVNMLIDQIVSNLASVEEKGSVTNPAVPNTIPVSMEDSVLGVNKSFKDVQLEGFSFNTLKYVAEKAFEGFRSPVILPDDPSSDASSKDDGSGLLGALTIISGNAPGGEADKMDRKSTTQFRKLSKETLSNLLSQCRENGVSMSNALSAAITLTSSDFIDGGTKSNLERNYKVLHSLDMRRFGAKVDKCESVACMAGSHDLMLGPLPDASGRKIRGSSGFSKDIFWKLAKEASKQTNDFISSGGPQEATRVFDFAMTISDMNNLVNLSAKSKDSQGRAYSSGIANAGIFERQTKVRRAKNESTSTLSTTHGRFRIDELYFATSHARSGCLFVASCLSVNDELLCSFHPAEPIVTSQTNLDFADAFIELLEVISGTKQPNPNLIVDDNKNSLLSGIKQVPVVAALLYGVLGIASHSSAWANFFDSVMQMKNAISDPADFWAALNFWIFFAVGHPLLQPILWISEVLHSTPGPKIADLIPVLFVAGNTAVIALVSASKEIRTALNVFAISAFFSYVGAGLDGQGGMGDFNLALDDNYNGQIVKGCPTYEEVRQDSMNNFDLTKYQGLWYEHKFHDWTQFKEVYDTTLDIKLTEDGLGWIDDFGVKGPSPESSPKSFDKSPVANGAHYFLFGRVDPNDPPGVLRESGFGVEFPNYIVDVQKDPTTGEYTEAIQFQCLERGGVRVFEGINFMSRSSEMTEKQLEDMHLRAEKAGMYPYGASPDQMHSVSRKPAGEISNSWQSMWKAIGFDKLLELVSESIEDGSR